MFDLFFLAGQPVPSSKGSKPRGVDPGDKVGKRSVDEIANMVYTVVHRLLTDYKKNTLYDVYHKLTTLAIGLRLNRERKTPFVYGIS